MEKEFLATIKVKGELNNKHQTIMAENKEEARKKVEEFFEQVTDDFADYFDYDEVIEVVEKEMKFPATIELGEKFKYDVMSSEHLEILFSQLCEEDFAIRWNDEYRFKLVKEEMQSTFERVIGYSWQEFCDLEIPSSAT